MAKTTEGHIKKKQRKYVKEVFLYVKRIVKRDGKIVKFDPEKIVDAITKAGLATEEFKADRARALAEKVVERAKEKITARTPNVEQIQDIVEEVLMESSFKKTARAYIRYRQERSRVRDAKSDLMMIYNAATIEARNLLLSGAIGEINDAEFHFEFPIGFNPIASKEWRCSKPEEKGGPIGDIGSHCFYTLEYVLGSKIKKLQAVNLPKVTETAIEDGNIIRVTLENNLLVTVRLSFASRRGSFLSMVSAQGYEVYGSKGVLRTYGTLFQFSGHPDEKFIPRVELETFEPYKRIDVHIDQSKVQNIYSAVIKRHAQSIIDQKFLDGSDALHNMKVCNAAYLSVAANGQEVFVN